MKKTAQVLSLLAFLLAGKGLLAKDPTQAMCKLEPASGSQVSGVISFTKSDGGILVKGDISGLTPGKHGFHIHENGDCTAPDAKSAGDHFNPDKGQHGAMEAGKKMHHEGDMNNVEADQSGKAHVEFVDKSLSFSGAHSIIGRAVVLHEKEDDLKSQPSGNSGARIACGVIGVVNPK